jgi:hypothetical protein
MESIYRIQKVQKPISNFFGGLGRKHTLNQDPLRSQSFLKSSRFLHWNDVKNVVY